MFLKPGEVCKFGNRCPFVVSGVEKCFGLKEGRQESFNCSFVLDDKGIFKGFSKTKEMNVDFNRKVL